MKSRNEKLDINALCTQYQTQLYSLTRCLESGSNYHLKYDKFMFNLEVGDDVFIATDGVYRFINLNDVSQIMKNSASQFEAISNIIVQKAIDNKSNDNLTSFVLERVNGDANK
jgi:serine/threonine protein phosphatase PrpC